MVTLKFQCLDVQEEKGDIPWGQYWDQCCLKSLLVTWTGIKCTLSKSVDVTQVSGPVKRPEGRDTVQRALDRLERWDL